MMKYQYDKPQVNCKDNEKLSLPLSSTGFMLAYIANKITINDKAQNHVGLFTLHHREMRFSITEGLQSFVKNNDPSLDLSCIEGTKSPTKSIFHNFITEGHNIIIVSNLFISGHFNPHNYFPLSQDVHFGVINHYAYQSAENDVQHNKFWST